MLIKPRLNTLPTETVAKKLSQENTLKAFRLCFVPIFFTYGGVQVTQASSEPDGGVSIRVRGVNLINANNEPVYEIDGLPINNSSVVPSSTAVMDCFKNPFNVLNFNNI